MSGSLDPVLEIYGHVVHRLLPAVDMTPTPLCILQGEEDQFARRLFARKGSLGLDHLADAPMRRLDRIRSVDHAAQFGRELEQGRDLRPILPPLAADVGVLLSP